MNIQYNNTCDVFVSQGAPGPAGLQGPLGPPGPRGYEVTPPPAATTSGF